MRVKGVGQHILDMNKQNILIADPPASPEQAVPRARGAARGRVRLRRSNCAAGVRRSEHRRPVREGRVCRCAGAPKAGPSRASHGAWQTAFERIFESAGPARPYVSR